MLFTDPVGLTALRGRLGEEAAEDLRREHDRMLTQTIEANSWRVVKNLGDGIKGTFAGAPDGVAAARAIQQAIERHTPLPGSAAALQVRVGVSAGDVTFERRLLRSGRGR